MSDITAFLLTRIAEDEITAGDMHGVCGIDTGGGECNCGQPGRVLAECVAKRRIVEYSGAIASDQSLPSTHLAQHVLSDLASAYAEHPDYREEWRA